MHRRSGGGVCIAIANRHHDLDQRSIAAVVPNGVGDQREPGGEFTGDDAVVTLIPVQRHALLFTAGGQIPVDPDRFGAARNRDRNQTGLDWLIAVSGQAILRRVGRLSVALGLKKRDKQEGAGVALGADVDAVQRVVGLQNVQRFLLDLNILVHFPAVDISREGSQGRGRRSIFGAQSDCVKHNPLEDQDNCHDTGVLAIQKSHRLLLAATKFEPRTSTWCHTMRMTSATMKITQPSAWWKKPSASSAFTWVMMPVMVTRLALATMAMGMVERNRTTRSQVFRSKK